MNNVLKLVKRELIFVFTSLKLQLIISIFFMCFFPFVSPSVSFMGLVVVPYFLIYGTMAYEERSKTQFVLATLPVSPTQICASKYLLGFFYIIVTLVSSMICLYLGGLVLPADPLRLMILDTLWPMISSLASIGLIYVSLILPILFKLGTEKSRYIMLLLYVGVFIAMPLLEDLLDVDRMSALLTQANPLIILFISVCIYLISLILSSSICEKKSY